MSPDLFFLLTLIVKMAITAGFVVAATVTAERVGPLLAGLVAMPGLFDVAWPSRARQTTGCAR